MIGRTSTSRFTLYIPFDSYVPDLEIQVKAFSLETLLNEPFYIEDEEVFLDFELGISYRQPEEISGLIDLVDSADLAIMEKSNPISPKIFTSDTHLLIEQEKRHHMVLALRQSLEDENFQVVYQPIVNLNEKQISMETLVRWKYDDEWIPPTVFIPIVESIGLIEKLTKLVLDKIIDDWKFWKEQFPDLTHISLNISPAMLELDDSDSFLEYLLQKLKENGIQNNQICLEITENVLLNEPTLRFINKSMKQGILIAVDDFGTGYSSMSYLARYPFDVLKIDRAFVEQLETNPKHQQVANAIVQLAKKLNVKVVAEGVETEEQLLILQQMGTDAVQGYYFSKPQFVEQWNSTILKEKIK